SKLPKSSETSEVWSAGGADGRPLRVALCFSPSSSPRNQDRPGAMMVVGEIQGHVRQVGHQDSKGHSMNPATSSANQQALLERIKPVEREFRAFLKALPGLLADGEEGRHVLIKGDEVISIWDTFRDGYPSGATAVRLRGAIPGAAHRPALPGV